MNKKNVLLVLLGIILVLLISFGVNKFNKYLNAMVEYKSLECFDRAYMIYKNYDNQKEEFRDRDWSLRNADCTETEVKYKTII